MPPHDPLRFNCDFLRRYIEIAPLALAMERSMECQILSEQRFERPILDVGCGDGVFASVLFNDQLDTGVDPDPAEVARASSSGRYLELIVCGGDAISKPDGTYRTIFSNSVLEHIPDLMPVLIEQNRLLAVGGRFYVTVPTDRWEGATWPARALHGLHLHPLAERYARFYNRFWHHFHAYPVAQWRALFEQAGFRLIEQQLYAPDNMTTLLDLLTPFAAPAMLSKKFMSRWIAIPSLRRLATPLIYGLTAPLFSAASRRDEGNLAFFALTK